MEKIYTLKTDTPYREDILLKVHSYEEMALLELLEDCGYIEIEEIDLANIADTKEYIERIKKNYGVK